MSGYRLIVVNKKYYRVWSGDSLFKDHDLVAGLRPDLHLKMAEDLADALDEADNDHAVLGLRLLYGLSQEAFFALLFALLQAPEAPTAWLVRYRPGDLPDLVKRFQRGAELPSRIVSPEAGSWEALAVSLFPEAIMEKQDSRERAQRLGGLWAEWAREFIDSDMRAEFNSLKHGNRIRSASPSVFIGSHRFAGPANGSWFPTFKASGADILLGVCSRSWSARILHSRLRLLAASTSNLIEVLRYIHKVGDSSRLEFDLPESDELDAATNTPTQTSITGMRMERQWSEAPRPPLDPGNARKEYFQRGPAPLRILGTLEDPPE